MDVEAQPLPPARRVQGPRQQQPRYDLREELYRVTGVDLTQFDGLDVLTAQSSLRFSFGRFNPAEDVDALMAALPSLVERQRATAPVSARGA